MARRKFQIVLPDAKLQYGLFSSHKSSDEISDEYPPVHRTPDAFRRVVEAAGPEGLGIDLEFSDTGRPSVLGVANLREAASVGWDKRLAEYAIDFSKRHNIALVGYSSISADKKILDNAGCPSSLDFWEDAMLTHYLANQHLCKIAYREEDDDPGSLGFMNLWSATSLVTDVPNWKSCWRQYCSGQYPCPTHNIWGYNGVDSWAGLKVHVENSKELDRMKVPITFRRELLELTDLCEVMRERGMRVHIPTVEALNLRISNLQDALFPEANRRFNPRSSLQVKTWMQERGLRLKDTQKNTLRDEMLKIGRKYSIIDKPNEVAEQLSEAPLTELESGVLDLWKSKEGGKGTEAWFGKKHLTEESEGVFLHSRFNTTGSSLGRLSSSSPNAHNFQKYGLGKQARAAIIPRSQDFRLCRADYKQLEARCIMYLAGFDIRDFPKDLFTWLVQNSEGKFDKAAELGGKKPRDLAKITSHGCVAAGHEVLTSNGWIDISKWSGQEIAVWDETYGIFFETPEKYHEYDYTGPTHVLHGRSASIEGTPEHGLPKIRRSNWGKKRYLHVDKVRIDSLENEDYLATSGVLITPGPVYSDREVMQAVAVQADGSVDKWGNVKFHFIKTRKIERMESLFSCKLKPCSDHKPHGRAGYVKWSSPLLDGTKQKNFTSELLKLTQRQREVFLAELPKWDGSTYPNSRVYRTTNYSNAVWVQTIAHLSGTQALVRGAQCRGFGKGCFVYTVSFNKRRNMCVGSADRFTRPFSGKVYCFSTSTGYFMIRYKDRVMVSGNSNYGMGLKVVTSQDLESSYVKSAILAGALRVYKDWPFAGGVVAFTGKHLANMLFGDESFGSRKKALEIQEDVYFAAFPQIRAWQKKVLAEFEARRYVKYPTGRFIRLIGPFREETALTRSMEEDSKIVLAAYGQGVSADHVQAVMLRYRRETGYVPILQVHDELVYELPREWPDKRCGEFIGLMQEETWRLPGFSCPVDAGLGENWLEAMNAADKNPLVLQ